MTSINAAFRGSNATTSVQANPATGEGAMKGVTYIQRLNTVGGTAAGTCTSENAGAKQVVKYSADYFFYKAS